jgi:phage tail-like protein
MAQNGTRRKAYGAYYFKVEIDGQLFGEFRSVSGLKSEAEVQSHGEGGLNTSEHKLIGRTKYSNITLKWGLCKGELWVKRMLFVNDGGCIRRISGSIIQMGPNGPEHTFRFMKGWICKWEGPDLDASKNEISIESIEIAHEGLLHSGPSGGKTKG